MSQTLVVTLLMDIADDAKPEEVAEAVFDLVCSSEDDAINYVDQYEWRLTDREHPWQR